ncbi:hypothetical protein BPORC_1455 [Bifidobacterium porcinum]|nr:hypothetical protein BPORC_1455 [Bifidobacterium porcinum]
MKVVHWAYQGGIFDHCVCGAESGAGIARGFFRPSGGRAELLREPDTPALNRESHAEIGTSPSRSRTAPGHHPWQHRKTLEFQRSGHITTISHCWPHSLNPPNHGPNQRTRLQNRSSPQLHQPSRPHPTTATSQNREISAIHPSAPVIKPQARNPSTGPNPWTKSENTGRNRNRSLTATDCTRPSIAVPSSQAHTRVG